MSNKLDTIKLYLYTDLLVPDEDIEIDKHNLGHEFRVFPSLYYRYSMERSHLQEKVGEAKAGLRELKSQIYVQLRSKMDKPTEKYLEMLTEQNETVVAQTRILARLEYELRNMDGFIEALRMKRDMLIQLGADARKEH